MSNLTKTPEKTSLWTWAERAATAVTIASGIGLSWLVTMVMKYVTLTHVIIGVGVVVALSGFRLWRTEKKLTRAVGVLNGIKAAREGLDPDGILFVTQGVGDADFVRLQPEGRISVLCKIRLVNKSQFVVSIEYLDLTWQVIANVSQALITKGSYSKRPPMDPLGPGEGAELSDLGEADGQIIKAPAQADRHAVLWLRGVITFSYALGTHRVNFNEGIVVGVADNRKPAPFYNIDPGKPDSPPGS